MTRGISTLSNMAVTYQSYRDTWHIILTPTNLIASQLFLYIAAPSYSFTFAVKINIVNIVITMFSRKPKTQSPLDTFITSWEPSNKHHTESNRHQMAKLFDDMIGPVPRNPSSEDVRRCVLSGLTQLSSLLGTPVKVEPLYLNDFVIGYAAKKQEQIIKQANKTKINNNNKKTKNNNKSKSTTSQQHGTKTA